MKISFSTLGCPEWSWEDMLVTASDLGFDGIEIRGIENELYAPHAKPFSESHIQATKERLAKMKLEIPCLTSSCYLFERADNDIHIKEGKDYIDIAGKLGVPFVRVLGDGTPEPVKKVDIDYVAENLLDLAEYAKNRNVKVLVETNGVFANSEEMLKLLNKAVDPNIGVLWDIHHPFRYFNEPVEKTFDALKDHILFVHLKDSVMEGGRVEYRMIGYGDVPVDEAVFMLKKNNYEGYVSLEWVKRWCIELEDPGIVFSHFINWVRRAAE